MKFAEPLFPKKLQNVFDWFGYIMTHVWGCFWTVFLCILVGWTLKKSVCLLRNENPEN